MRFPTWLTWKRVIITTLIIGGGGFGAFRYFTAVPQSKYVSAEVVRRDLVQTVQATGRVESAEEISLNFGVSGRVAVLHVKVGDRVRAGQELGRLDMGTISAQIADATAAFQAQKAALERLEAGATREDIALTERTLESARTTLQNAERQKQTDIQNQLRAIDAQVDREMFTVRTALDAAQTILNPANPDLAQRIGNKNFSATTLARNLIRDLNSNIDTQRSELSNASLTTVEDARLVTDRALHLMTQVASVLDRSFTVVSDTLPDTVLNQSLLDSYRASIQNQQIAVKNAIAGFNTSRSTLESTITNYDAQIESARKSIAVNEAQLALKKAPATPQDIAAARARVDQASAAIQSLRARLADYRIVSPVNGVVSKRNNEVGEQAVAGQPVLALVGDAELQVQVDVPEADIAKVKIGDVVRLNFDAFGRDRDFPGTVVRIEPAATRIQDATYYRVKVSFAQDLGVKSGMTADAFITTAQKKDVITIPQRAIRADNEGRFVEVLTGAPPQEKVEKRRVQLGLRGDGGLVEILEGLSENEKVVIGTQQQR